MSINTREKANKPNRKISKGYEHGFQKRKYESFLKCEDVYSLRLLGHKLYREYINLSKELQLVPPRCKGGFYPSV